MLNDRLKDVKRPEIILPNMPEAALFEFYERLRKRVISYDVFSPEAEYLRPHQVEPIVAFCETVEAITKGVTINEGMSILHPTGSGKTAMAAEIIRIICGPHPEDLQPSPRVIMLVPGHQLKDQVVGSEEEIGAINKFLPNISVDEYSGKRKTVTATVTVMTYQSLQGAIERGDIDRIDPSLIICDEAHHVIDGTWAEGVAQIAKGRLLMGLTATSMYSETRGIKKLFPIVLASKSMKEGIEEGILAGVRGFMYRGSSRIKVTGKGTDYNEEDLFNAIATSTDNLRAARICRAEIEQGRRGVVSCVPGANRAHAKIMTKILSQVKVKAPDGERLIRAVYVDGDTQDDNLYRIFRDYRGGKIDVISYVSLLLEGWDSPESEFSVMLRPTSSRIIAEQRFGRIVRPYKDKTATVHEFLYEVEGDGAPQVTHLDILDRPLISQGEYIGSQKKKRPSTDGASQGPVFNVDQFTIDSGLEEQMAALDDKPLKDIRISCGQEVIPYDWNTSYMIGEELGMERDEINRLLDQLNIPNKTKIVGGSERVYYSPEAIRSIATHLGMEEMSDDFVTVGILADYARNKAHRRISTQQLQEAFASIGIFPEKRLLNNKIVTAYPTAAKDKIASLGLGVHTGDEVIYKVKGHEPNGVVVNWLAQILTDPSVVPSPRRRRQLLLAQTCLISALKEAKKIPEEVIRDTNKSIKRMDIKPTAQMENVMAKNGLGFAAFIAIGARARQQFLSH